MAANIANYSGREQAYVKHYFLENYLERLIHKTASKFDEIAYVDGFSGPWQSNGQNFEDTSFGIALASLRRAKASWKSRGRDVRMSAYLVERSKGSYENLRTVAARFPDVSVQTYNADFVAVATNLLADVPSKAFVFLFIDPKGWRINISAIAGLLKRPNSEIVFNFMFEFINRAASITDPAVVDGLNELMLYGSWHERLAALSGSDNASAASTRKEVLEDAFSETLARVGNYPYVAATPVLRPLKDRILYSLIYATRKPAGLEVFRDCQVKTLCEQSSVRGAAKVANAQTASGQSELFGSLTQMGPDENAAYLAQERLAAEAALLDFAPACPASAHYGSVWPRVLAKHAVRRTELNAIAASLRKNGRLIFPTWEANKRVPDDTYLVCRPG